MQARAVWIFASVLGLAGGVLGLAPSAGAVSLSLSTDKTAYAVGETIEVTLVGDTTGAANTGLAFVELVYDDESIVDGLGAFATQDVITSLGGLISWLTANPACDVDGCVVFNQLDSSGAPVDPLTVVGKLTLPTTAAGLLAISPGIVDFFGATPPPPVVVTIGGDALETIFDTQLANASWSLLTLTAGCSSFSTGQVVSGGNPSAYRRSERTCSGTFAPFHFYEWELGDFDPATIPSGQSLAISYCEDGIAPGLPAAATVESAFAFWQGGTLFAGPMLSIDSGSWERRCQFLEAGDFAPLLGSTPQPDFSPGGAVMRVGHVRRVSGSSASPIVVTDGIDNYGATFLPEPGSALGLGGSALALAALCRRRSA